MEGATSSLTFPLALVAGVVAQSIARHVRLPGIVLLLAAGVGLGPEGLGWVEPHSLGSGLLAIVDLAVAVILFEGGMNLELSRLRREGVAIRRLVTWGALITLAGATLSVRAFLGWDWSSALLFGSLVVVTGPTVVGPLVRGLRLRPRVATVLEAEGVLIDPIGAILAVLVLELTLQPTPGALASGGLDLLVRVGFGLAAGAAGGFALGGLLRWRRILPDGFENIFALAFVLFLFQGCEEVVSHSGILAVTIAGVAVGNLKTRVDRDLREFKDQLSVMLIGLLFVLLAAGVSIDDVRALGWSGLAVVGALIFVVRPIDVGISTLGSELSMSERALVAWLAPRGIVAAAIASITAATLEPGGRGGGDELRALVFMTIAGTVLLAGTTALPVANLLGVRLPGRDTVAILGAEGLGLALASRLRDAGIPVVFLDSNADSCRRAEEAGFPVIFGNALQERTLQRARFEAVGTAIGLTANDSLNGMFVSLARETYGVPEVYAALQRLDSGVTPEFLESKQADVLFDGPHDVERWDVRYRHGELRVEQRVFAAPTDGEEEPVPHRERYVILAVERAGSVRPMGATFRPRAGDVATVALYAQEADEGRLALEALGWRVPEGDAVAPVES